MVATNGKRIAKTPAKTAEQTPAQTSEQTANKVSRLPAFYDVPKLFGLLDTYMHLLNADKNIDPSGDKMGIYCHDFPTELQPQYNDLAGIYKIEVASQPLTVAVYDDKRTLQFFALPRFFKSGESIISIMGVDAPDRGYSAKQIELVFDDGKYKVNGTAVKLRVKEINDNLRAFIVIPGKAYNHIISLKIDEEATEEQLEYAFTQGELHQYVTNQFKPSVAFNKMFRFLMDCKQFPKDGIVMILESGQKHITPASEAPFKTSKDVVSSSWRLVNTSHPELVVMSAKGDSCVLADVGTVYFTEAAQPTTLSDATNVCAVWVIGQNKRNKNHLPEHSAVAKLATLLAVLPKDLKNSIAGAGQPTTRDLPVLEYSDDADPVF